MKKMHGNHLLKKYQMIALLNVIDSITFNEDTDEDKISKIKYWFGLKYEL